MHHIFRNFIDSLSSAHDANGLPEAMDRAATALGLSCFAYLSMPRRPRSDPRLITSYPSAWIEQYLNSCTRPAALFGTIFNFTTFVLPLSVGVLLKNSSITLVLFLCPEVWTRSNSRELARPNRTSTITLRQEGR
jgi:hypothetical protein